MAVTYSTAVKNARMDAVKAQIDSGSTVAEGYLEIGTAGMAGVIVKFPLRVPGSGGAANAASGGVLTLIFDSGTGSATKAATLAGTNTAAAARIRNRDNADVVTGLTVGLSAASPDIVLDSTSITQGQNVTINSATITHAT